jgi:hypothetical protein
MMQESPRQSSNFAGGNGSRRYRRRLVPRRDEFFNNVRTGTGLPKLTV